MAPESNNLVDERWRSDYAQRAQAVGYDLAALFQSAFDPERLRGVRGKQIVSKAVQFVRKQRKAFPHPIVLFIYSSRFDAEVAKDLLDPEVTKAALPEGVTEKHLFDDKAKNLERVFEAVTYCADQSAHHFVAAMMEAGEVPQLPLVWQVPKPDEAATGFPSEMMWWATFQCLCEVSRAIVAYGGLTRALFTELSYIRQTPRLEKRLVWLDVNLNLFFPDRVEEQWPLRELPTVIEKMR